MPKAMTPIRRQVYFLGTGLATLLIFIFGMEALIEGHLTLAIVDLSTTGLLLILLFLAYKLPDSSIPVYASLVVVCSLFLYFLVTETHGNMGFVWIVIIPLTVHFVFGWKQGIILSALFFGICTAIALWSYLLTTIPGIPEPVNLSRIGIIYLVSLGISSFYDFEIEKAHQKNQKTGRALKKSKKRLDTLLSHTPAIIYSFKIIKNLPIFTYINENIKTVLGHSPNKFLEKPAAWINSIHPEDREQIKLELLQSEETLNDNNQISLPEYRFIDNNGDYHWLRGEHRLLKNSGKSPEIIGVAVDITAQKKATEKLREATLEAQNANRAKSQFLARMSHEIRTPMNSILGMSELLRETELTVEQDHYIKIFQSSAETLLTLINEILDLSKINAGELTLENAYFDPTELLSNLADFFSHKAYARGLNLNLFVDPKTPEEIYTDCSRLHQVLVNLLENSLKFTTHGEINLELKVVAQTAKKSTLLFSVKDTGIGIPPEKHELIFNQFAQVDETATRKHQGSGLGLSICKQLIRHMGGEIWVDSKPGEGSKFQFQLTLPHRNKLSGSPQFNLNTLTGSMLLIGNNKTNLARIMHEE